MTDISVSGAMLASAAYFRAASGLALAQTLAGSTPPDVFSTLSAIATNKATQVNQTQAKVTSQQTINTLAGALQQIAGASNLPGLTVADISDFAQQILAKAFNTKVAA